MTTGTTAKQVEPRARTGLGHDGERDVLASRLADVTVELPTRRHWWQWDLAGEFIRLIDRMKPNLRKTRLAPRDHVGMFSPDAGHDTT